MLFNDYRNILFLGSTVGYYVQREAPYNIGPNDPYLIEVSPYHLQEPSQRLFWGNGQGSNQVGGQGWWATITNKFPFLQNMFGRLEVPTRYGVPSQLSTNYGVPSQLVATQYGVPSPQVYSQYGVPARVQPVFYQPPPYNQRVPQFFPSGRDVALTDDAVIVTPPHVPISPPRPVPAPAPVPTPAPEPSPGYQYNKPQYRLELPHK